MNPSSKGFFSNKIMYSMVNKVHGNVLSLFVFAMFFGFFSIGDIPNNYDAFAQHSQLFKVIVSVTNNENIDEHGAIHVYVDGGSTSKWLNNVFFPSKQTVSHTFEFVSNDIPTGTGFTTEVIYGDDVFKRLSGINSASNAPETIHINIP